MTALLLAAAITFGIAGDSVTHISADELRAEGATVEAFGGVDILQAREALQRFAVNGRRNVVVAVGIMDVASWANERQLRARVRAVLRDLRPVRCVLWVDLRYGSRPPGLRDDRVRMFARVLDDLTGQFGRHVAAWSAASADHPEWFTDDRLHPNRLGQTGYARFLAGQVDRYCN